MKTIATFLSTGSNRNNYDVCAMIKPKLSEIALCIDTELVHCVEQVFELQVSLIPAPSVHINRDIMCFSQFCNFRFVLSLVYLPITVNNKVLEVGLTCSLLRQNE